MQNDFNSKLKKKDEDIAELRKKIEDMSNEFARMLKETLDKMQERVDQAQWDNDTDPYMIKKLKEIAIKDT
jgi:gas vesicle protein